jgi:peptidoglycan/xylan/chitin deacetylase (PgdA/CDA1 family)
MYHHIGPTESRFTISPERLRAQLDELRKKSYQLTTFSTYAEGQAEGRSAVLTFDDSTRDQFNYLDDGNIDPSSAIGVLEKYKSQYPEFKITATFFINTSMPKGLPAFEQPGKEKEKLQFLIDHGYELGSHSDHHAALKSKVQTWQELSAFKVKMEGLVPGYEVKAFAYPFGSLPSIDVQREVEKEFPYTAHAWGGIAKDQGPNIPRIEVNPRTKFTSYLSGELEIGALARGNVYKEAPNLSTYARNNPQLQAQHPQTIWQPDDCYRGWRGLKGKGKGSSRKDSTLQYWKEGDQGRGPLIPWQQGSFASPFRKWYAWSSYWQAGQNPVSF